MIFTLIIDTLLPNGTLTANVSFRMGGIAMHRTMLGLRRRCKFSMAMRSGSISVGHGISISTGGRSVDAVLDHVFAKRGIACAIAGGDVVVRGQGRPARGAPTAPGPHPVSKGIVGNASGRPLVNIAILGPRSNGNMVAGIGNSCSVRTVSKRALGFSCMNFSSISVGMNGSGILGVAVARGSAVLGRMMMIKFNDRGGMGLAKTIKIVKGRRVGNHPITSTTRTLRKLSPSLGVNVGANETSSNCRVSVHNTTSLGKNAPLVLISNIRVRLGHLGPGSVRSMSVLGSTTTTSMCNTGTSTNMMLIAAGANDSSDMGIACGNHFNLLGGAADASCVADNCS